MGHEARWEYFRAIYGRYQKGDRKARKAVLNEFCLNTGYHRRYQGLDCPPSSVAGPGRKRIRLRKDRAAGAASWIKWLARVAGRKIAASSLSILSFDIRT